MPNSDLRSSFFRNDFNPKAQIRGQVACVSNCNSDCDPSIFQRCSAEALCSSAFQTSIVLGGRIVGEPRIDVPTRRVPRSFRIALPSFPASRCRRRSREVSWRSTPSEPLHPREQRKSIVVPSILRVPVSVSTSTRPRLASVHRQSPSCHRYYYLSHSHTHASLRAPFFCSVFVRSPSCLCHRIIVIPPTPTPRTPSPFSPLSHLDTLIERFSFSSSFPSSTPQRVRVARLRSAYVLSLGVALQVSRTLRRGLIIEIRPRERSIRVAESKQTKLREKVFGSLERLPSPKESLAAFLRLSAIGKPRARRRLAVDIG